MKNLKTKIAVMLSATLLVVPSMALSSPISINYSIDDDTIVKDVVADNFDDVIIEDIVTDNFDDVIIEDIVTDNFDDVIIEDIVTENLDDIIIDTDILDYFENNSVAENTSTEILVAEIEDIIIDNTYTIEPDIRPFDIQMNEFGKLVFVYY